MFERPPNIRHLAAFAATVKHGSVTRAADAVHLTQPAVTQAISRLEHELECQLFEREPSGMRPTEVAQILARRTWPAIARIGSPRVTSTQIRAFLALARAGSYSSAAERTGLSAASLHRAVGDLSLALGERLVERRGRHLALTRKGEMRARNFGLALAELRSGFAEVAAWLGKAGARIVIGAMPLSRARWLPRAILSFGQHNPDVDIVVVEGSHSELVGPLRDGDIDFLLGALRHEDGFEDLIQQTVFDDCPQIIMRSGHPLAGSREIGTEALAAQQWIVPPAPTPLRGYWEDMFNRAGIASPHVAIECGSAITIREILLHSDNLTLLSPAQLRVEIEAGLLVAIQPPSRVSREIGITTRRDWHPTSSQRNLLEILRHEGKRFS